jgi:hypothetical protein
MTVEVTEEMPRPRRIDDVVVHPHPRLHDMDVAMSGDIG